jgi:hypothetical protein
MIRKPRNVNIPVRLPRQANLPRTGRSAVRQATSQGGVGHSGMPRGQNQAAANNRSCQPWMLIIVVAVVLICVCIIAAGGVGYYFYTHRNTTTQSLENDGTTQPEENQPVVKQMKVVESVPANPDGQFVYDDQGAGLALPVDGLETGGQAELVAMEPGSDLEKSLKGDYILESRIYSIQLKNSLDATERSQLVIPAASPDSRLAVLIDGKYFGVLAVEPTGDQLAVEAFLGDPAAESNYPRMLSSDSAIQYMVVTPNQSSLPSSGGHLMSPVAAEDDSGTSCSASTWLHSHCWRNTAGTVFVYWEDDYPQELNNQEYVVVEDTIHVTENIMSALSGLGLTNATLTTSSPMYVIIEKGLKSPYYSPRSGNIYMPWDIVARIGDGANQQTLSHEMIHWVQDEEYRMLADYYSGPGSWWLETTAEAIGFLIQPGKLDTNLTFYGKTTVNAGILGFQAEPFTWDSGEESRYIHAQQLFLSLCEGPGCALSEKQMVDAINAGSYPFSNGTTQAAYLTNAKELGRYLIGLPPQQGRTNIALPPAVSNGRGYGDYLAGKTNNAGDATFDFGFTDANRKISLGEVTVTAPIKKGGVYPLRVSNGANGPFGDKGLPGLPFTLVVGPGASFWARQDSGEAIFYDGSQPVTFAPIHSDMGITLVRLAGVAPDQDQVFNAKANIIDIAGDYASQLSNAKVTYSACGDEEPSPNSETADDTFLQYFGGYGTYVRDPDVEDGSHLIWEGQSPEGIILTSDILILSDRIVLNYQMDIPKSEESSFILPSKPELAFMVRKTAGNLPNHTPGASRLSPWLTLGALPLLGIAGRFNKDRRMIWVLLALLLVGIAIVLTGCFGMNIYGAISGTYSYTKLEYIDPAQNPYGDERYHWRLAEGKGTIDMNLVIEVITEDDNGNETSQAENCDISYEADLQGFIGEDGLVAPPENDSSGG